MSEYFPGEVAGNTFRIKQTVCGERKGVGTGGAVWDSAQVLVKYMERRYGANGMAGKCVLDMGTGTGVVGLAAAILGAENVLLTDSGPILPLAKANIDLCAKETGIPDITKRVKTARYVWGKTAPDGPFDVVTVCDCLVPKLYPVPPLVNAIKLALEQKPAESIALVCYEHRLHTPFDPRVEFKKQCEHAGMTLRSIDRKKWHPDYVLSDVYIWEVALSRANNTSSSSDKPSPGRSRATMLSELAQGAAAGESVGESAGDNSAKFILARGCDPVMAARASAKLPPMLGNPTLVAVTDDDAFADQLKRRAWDVVLFAPGSCRHNAAGRPIPGSREATKGWTLKEYRKLVRDVQGPEVQIVETPDEKQVVPRLRTALCAADRV